MQQLHVWLCGGILFLVTRPSRLHSPCQQHHAASGYDLGKLRDTIALPADAGEEELELAAKASSKVQTHLAGKTIRKVIVVPGKIVNIVAG